jgi:hypothetical protein
MLSVRVIFCLIITAITAQTSYAYEEERYTCVGTYIFSNAIREYEIVEVYIARHDTHTYFSVDFYGASSNRDGESVTESDDKIIMKNDNWGGASKVFSVLDKSKNTLLFVTNGLDGSKGVKFTGECH